MNRIELRGVIVPSDYDSDWAQKYIERGIIMPESYFRRKLAEAAKDAPLDVYINSPGGSVFSASEMVNAVREWKAATGQAVNVTIGAMAASAASAFAIMAGDTIRTHKNGKMMFHGAWTVSIGGKEMHQDTADLLGKINAEIQTRLVSRYKLQPETIAEWFAEGREGWLTADDMKASGIASEIIEDPSDVIDFAAAAVADMEQRGLGIAALLKQNTETAEAENAGSESDNDTDAGGRDPGGNAGSGDGPEHGTDDGASGACAGGQADGVATDAAIQAAVEAARAELTGEYAERIATLEKRMSDSISHGRTLQSERDKLLAEAGRMKAEHEKSLNDLTGRLQVAQARLAKFVDGALSFSPSPTSWADALRICGGDYAKAAKQYPELKREYNQQKQ
jgi:ATP-dependent Clp protease protease subunit